jgi:hypothetical protein
MGKYLGNDISVNTLCHSEQSEDSRYHKVGVTEILRFALNDKGC